MDARVNSKTLEVRGSNGLPSPGGLQDWLQAVLPSPDAARNAAELLEGTCANSLRALQSDFANFQAFCMKQGLVAFPIGVESCCKYLRWCAAQRKAPATLRRYIASFSRLNTLAGAKSLKGNERIKATMRAVYAELPRQQGHAKRLGWEEFEPLLQYTGRDLRVLRDRAILCIGYDALLRRSEIVSIDAEDVSVAQDGSGLLRVRYSKADQQGVGAELFLTKPTIRAVLAWQRASGITQGALFRRLVRRRDAPHLVVDRLSAAAIPDILKRSARWLGIAQEGISGHSLRVGAMEDLVTAGVSTPGVMNAARLASDRMVTTYTRGIAATRGAVAAVANAKGRNS